MAFYRRYHAHLGNMGTFDNLEKSLAPSASFGVYYESLLKLTKNQKKIKQRFSCSCIRRGKRLL